MNENCQPFCVIFPCLQQERIASSDFQGLHSSEELFKMCHLCLFYRWLLYMYSIHWQSQKNIPTIMVRITLRTTCSSDFSFCHVYSFLMIFSYFFHKTMLHSGPTKAFLTRVGLVTSKSSPTIWTFWPTWNIDGQNKLVSCSLVRQCMLMSWWNL